MSCPSASPPGCTSSAVRKNNRARGSKPPLTSPVEFTQLASPPRPGRGAALWVGLFVCAACAGGAGLAGLTGGCALAAESVAAGPAASGASIPADRSASGESGAAHRSAAAEARLGFIARLFAERDDFRTESEVLAFLHEAPDDPLRPQVELVRAKLYYRAGRLAEADAIAISLLDRMPQGPVAADARTLLGFSWMRQGRLAEAAPLLAAEPPLNPLQDPAPYDAGRATGWSTALPGTGFFALGEPVRGATALALNLAFVAGTAIAYQQHNVPAALIFLSVEAALYSGGRDAVREEAGKLNDRWLEQRREAWLARSSEPRLLAVAFDAKF